MCEERERKGKAAVLPEEFEWTIRALGPLNGLTVEGWAEFTRVFQGRRQNIDPESQGTIVSLIREVHEGQT
jgi:hypothetical protein